MTQHIVCRIGPTDDFLPALGDGSHLQFATIDGKSDASAVRNSVVSELQRTGVLPSQTAFDLLHLAMAVYSADLCTHRSTGYDSWTRDIHLNLPVSAPRDWEPSRDLVAEMLGFLTGDHWVVEFRELRADGHFPHDSVKVDPARLTPDAVSLFSGGLDSFIGIMERLDAREQLALVGHHGMGTTNRAQERTFETLKRNFPDRLEWLRFYVQQPSVSEGEFEKTTRSRSILFLSLGTAVATGYGRTLPLYVPENGLISLNPPLTASRMGSLSTRTTHPHFIALYRRLLDALRIDVTIETPYRFQTKGEMARRLVVHSTFLAGVHETVSCSHPDVGRYQGNSPGQHCGYCVPCIIRRAALSAAGLDEPGRYLLDIRTNRPAHGSETARDLRAFEMATRRFSESPRAKDLFEVLSTGPLPPESAAELTAVYRRGMEEIASFLSTGAATQ
jgi:hypothetical protein